MADGIKEKILLILEMESGTKEKILRIKMTMGYGMKERNLKILEIVNMISGRNMKIRVMGSMINQSHGELI